MRDVREVVIVGKGQHGPFEDGRVIPFVTVNDTDGNGDALQATCATGVDPKDWPVFRPVKLDLEFYSRDNRIKLRCHGASVKDNS